MIVGGEKEEEGRDESEKERELHGVRSGQSAALNTDLKLYVLIWLGTVAC